ncbi:DNA-3-methyladenine glycosylase family protein [Atopomonas sediminilitoris]|uniref:DNA-3-methyladenine glycosylase family protein n=1 Tax=Atopomonas sediminilitoris TaxID=2919919 RepID=UPI001F4E1F40|nr:DNA-3-methyladenine glycosylase 2 family protein [Atopomonas sediminilitoris]MCJ8169401.1 DNA-3-methyladenine glycosylase 2 family protein [Atopomonas sediminilitoris]
MNAQQIEQGLVCLRLADPALAAALEQLGPPPPRTRPAGMATLVSTIVSQQISTHAAAAIMGRVHALLPQLNAANVLATPTQALRDAGLSQRKVEYVQGLALAVVSGDLALDALDSLSDEQAIAQLSALRGFGRWSAEIYLMFSLGRQDLFPADDLALRVALGRLRGLADKPTPKHARALTECWAPWRSVGALFLWHYYRGAPT